MVRFRADTSREFILCVFLQHLSHEIPDPQLHMVEDEVFERWTANRKAALVLHLLKGKWTPADACRKYDLKQSEAEEWMELFAQGGINRLKSRPQDEQTLFEEQERRFKTKIGGLVLEVGILKKALAESRSDERT